MIKSRHSSFFSSPPYIFFSRADGRWVVATCDFGCHEQGVRGAVRIHVDARAHGHGAAGVDQLWTWGSEWGSIEVGVGLERGRIGVRLGSEGRDVGRIGVRTRLEWGQIWVGTGLEKADER